MSNASSAGFVDYYELLGVEPTAEIPEIRRAFILMAKQHHPDTGGSTDSMQLLNKAYKTLTSSTAKAAYDMLHSIEVGTTTASDYRYSGGREVSGVDDMTDDEIDDFLDTLLDEYRDGPPKTKSSVGDKLKKYFKSA
jgi:curved DNA-binding protein CbpA